MVFRIGFCKQLKFFLQNWNQFEKSNFRLLVVEMCCCGVFVEKISGTKQAEKCVLDW